MNDGVHGIHITGGAVTSTTIGGDAVRARHIFGNAVEGSEINSEVVCGSGDLTADCDGSGGAKTHIKAGTIGTADIASGGVEMGNLAQGVQDAIAAGGAAANSITETELGDGVVCGSDATTTDNCDGAGGMQTHIKAGSIGTADISPAAMTALQTDTIARTAAGDAADDADTAQMAADAAQADADTAQAAADTAQAAAMAAATAAADAQADADVVDSDENYGRHHQHR